MTKKMYIMRGLPGSGKSTKARSIVDAADVQSQSAIILSTDDIISGRDGKGYLWSADYQAQAHALNQMKAREACKQAYEHVIVDNTNTTWSECKPYFAIAKEFGYEVQLEQPDTPWKDDPEQCYIQTTHKVPLKIIEGMAKRFQSDKLVWRSAKSQDTRTANEDAPLPANPQVIDDKLPYCILIDLDGTLCLFQKEGKGPNCRNPYDASRCDEIDLPNEAITYLLRLINRSNETSDYEDEYLHVILMSGRDGQYRPQTERWLKKHFIKYDALYMRAEGDRRKDSLVKRELFEQHIRGKFNVRFVIDDRPQVIRMWKNELGLFVFDVGDGVEF